ncbi:UDP-N-acetylglucosamine 1-carboxyvinyltransferase [Candidatus Margulisiibacteriota bacterium]
MKKASIIGGKKLRGEVAVSGSKNAALPILAATILLRGEAVITNIPNLNDITTMIRVLRALGLRAEFHEPDTVKIYTGDKVRHVAPYELVTKMRASFFVIGPILAKMGLAKVPLPGGCAIGSRPVDLHIRGLEALGAKVEMEHGFVIVKANKLVGNRFYMDFPSVGATETIMMAATVAEGDTIIENAAREPEIADLANFLNKCGAKIEGIGEETIKITGVKELSSVEYRVIPDRIEAATLMIAGAITHGDITVKGIIEEHIKAISRKLAAAGVDIKIEGDNVKVRVPDGINSVDIKTLPYPGFPTDVQPQFTSFMSLAKGTSVIAETVFENRFMHLHELKRMGADIKLEKQSAIIKGVKKLSGCPVRVSDLRAGAALVLAGLVAEGETLIEDMDRHIERGYENLIEKLNSLGANMKEINGAGESGFILK